jgi:hypothetical protein
VYKRLAYSYLVSQLIRALAVTPLLSNLLTRKPSRFFVYPIVVDAAGNEEFGMRLECLTFDDAVYVARRLVPEISAAVAVGAHELIPDEEGREGEIVFADVATVGNVSDQVLHALGLAEHQTLQRADDI